MASEPGVEAALSPDASQLGADGGRCYSHSAMASEVLRLAALAAKTNFVTLLCEFFETLPAKEMKKRSQLGMVRTPTALERKYPGILVFADEYTVVGGEIRETMLQQEDYVFRILFLRQTAGHPNYKKNYKNTIW